MVRKKVFWLSLMGVLLVGCGAYAAYSTWFAPRVGAQATPTVATGTVTVGNLSITASGTGVLVPSVEMNLSFGSNGLVEGLLVQAGDRVAVGDMLAWIDDSAAQQNVAAAEVQVLEAEQSLALAQAQADLSLAQAQADLAVAQSNLDDLVNWEPDADEVKLAKANLYSAQVAYRATSTKADMRTEQTTSEQVSLNQALRNLAEAQTNYTEALNPERDWERNIEDTRASASASLLRAQESLAVAQASYSLNTIDSSGADVQSAWAKVLSAQSALDELQTPPDAETLTAARIAVQQAQLAVQQAELTTRDVGDGQSAAVRQAQLTLAQAQFNLTEARQVLSDTQLIAPFAGTITAVNVAVGDTASGVALVLANLDAPIVQFWVEESDLQNVAVGHPVKIVFEALPDLTYSGKITRVDPVLVTVSNVSAVQAWASIETDAHPVTLLGDMNAAVEVVAGEANNALLVPVEALRKVNDTEYAVFVVQPNGELEMRMVEVGLMDYVNAEIKSGLQEGDVVTLGDGASSSSSSSTTIERQSDFGPMDGPMMMPPGN